MASRSSQPRGSQRGVNGLVSTIDVAERFSLRRALADAVRAAGEQMRSTRQVSWEGQSLNGDHLWSRNDLTSLGHLIHLVAERFGSEGLKLQPTFENEELPLIPQDAGRTIRLVIDPIDGSKAFDNAADPGDVPTPPPTSAISVAAVCPSSGLTLATAVWCFDLGEVYSSVCIGHAAEGEPQHIAFRNDSMLRALPPLSAEPRIEARRRVLNGNYNARALVEIARLDLALMDRGLKPVYGGLAGASAVDIVNVVRGSFAVCVDVRALCGRAGSVPYFYDVAGALPIAVGRGLRVIVTGSNGQPLPGDIPIYTPVSFVVSRSDIADTVIEAVRETVCPAFVSEAPLSRSGGTVAKSALVNLPANSSIGRAKTASVSNGGRR